MGLSGRTGRQHLLKDIKLDFKACIYVTSTVSVYSQSMCPYLSNSTIWYISIESTMAKILTFFGSYMPQLSTVDGISSYWNRKRRTVHVEGFCGLSLHCHPQMLQSLPAKVEADLEMRADFIAIEQEIEALKEKLRRVSIKDETQPDRVRREELYG